MRGKTLHLIICELKNFFVSYMLTNEETESDRIWRFFNLLLISCLLILAEKN